MLASPDMAAPIDYGSGMAEEYPAAAPCIPEQREAQEFQGTDDLSDSAVTAEGLSQSPEIWLGSSALQETVADEFSARVDQMAVRATDGDAAALDDLLRTILPNVRNFCYRRLANNGAGSARASAEDAVQETLIGVARALSDGAYSTNAFLGLVYGIAHHKVIDQNRVVHRHDVSMAVPPEAMPDKPDPRDDYTYCDRQAMAQSLLAGILDELDPDTRRLVVDHYEHGATGAQLATGRTSAKTGEPLSPTGARVRLHRAVKQIRQEHGADFAVLMTDND